MKLTEKTFYLAKLIAGYFKGSLSEAEHHVLEGWLAEWEKNQTLMNDLVDGDKLQGRLNEFNNVDRKAVWDKITLNLNRTEYQKAKRISFRFKWLVAACLLLTLSAMVYFYQFRSSPNNEIKFAQYNKYIRPGKNAATLTLSNGNQIILSDSVNGVVANETGVQISRSGGQLVYQLSDSKSKSADHDGNTVKYNKLSTSRGQTYKIVLPDGSSVWLNAASSITYPASFSSLKTRVIQLEGEAYFEVAKDKEHPFVVKSGAQEVEVLGTHFNINSYKEEDRISTTLLEGRVAVRFAFAKLLERANAVILEPSQQSVLIGNKAITRYVETSDVVAWKNGYFMFNNEKFGDIMQTLCRWYNTTVEFEDQTLKNELVFTKLSRYDHISKILYVLEKTGKVKFKVNNNTIIVSRRD